VFRQIWPWGKNLAEGSAITPTAVSDVDPSSRMIIGFLRREFCEDGVALSVRPRAAARLAHPCGLNPDDEVDATGTPGLAKNSSPIGPAAPGRAART